MRIASKRLVRLAFILLAASLSWFATGARAGCGTVVTLNPTSHWVWITVYDVGQNIHLDYGWVAPHSGRKWTGGATALKYACGSFYHVRYEIKGGTNQPQPPGNVPNIFDTRMLINPQLTFADILSLLHAIAEGVSCVTPGLDGKCLVELGIEQGAEVALVGAIGSESQGSVVCLKTNDDVKFWLDGQENCLEKPKPAAMKYTIVPTSLTRGIGSNSGGYRIHVYLNGSPIGVQEEAKGRFYTDNPGIATFPDPKVAVFRGVKKGTTQAHWDYDNKRQASMTLVIE
jgi:hypothetical protein